jgi:hypothetical protein
VLAAPVTTLPHATPIQHNRCIHILLQPLFFVLGSIVILAGDEGE